MMKERFIMTNDYFKLVMKFIICSYRFLVKNCIFVLKKYSMQLFQKNKYSLLDLREVSFKLERDIQSLFEKNLSQILG